MVQSFIIDCFKERKNEKQAINHVLFLCTVPWAVYLGISRKLFRYFASFHTVGVVYLWLWYIDILSSHYVFIFLYSHIYNIVNIYSEYSYKMNVGFIFKPVSRVTRAMYITFLKKKKKSVRSFMHNECESYNMEWIIKWLKFTVSLKAMGGPCGGNCTCILHLTNWITATNLYNYNSETGISSWSRVIRSRTILEGSNWILRKSPLHEHDLYRNQCFHLFYFKNSE